MNELNWNYILMMAAVPPVVALLAAIPFWWKEQPIFGNLAGTAVLFGAAFALMMREHAILDRGIAKCFEEGIPCFPDPPAFTRYAIYGFIALTQVVLLFLVSLRVERKLRNRGYDPQWR